MIKAETHDDRVALMTKSLRAGGEFLEETMEFAAQVSRRHGDLNDRDRAEEKGQAMMFAGDNAGARRLLGLFYGAGGTRTCLAGTCRTSCEGGVMSFGTHAESMSMAQKGILETCGRPRPR